VIALTQDDGVLEVHRGPTDLTSTCSSSTIHRQTVAGAIRYLGQRCDQRKHRRGNILALPRPRPRPPPPGAHRSPPSGSPSYTYAKLLQSCGTSILTLPPGFTMTSINIPGLTMVIGPVAPACVPAMIRTRLLLSSTTGMSEAW
jgi:hypothetical protein